MTKEIQRLKKQLLMEELRRQGKTGKKTLLIGIALVLVILILAGGFWYRANLDVILDKQYREAMALKQSEQYPAAVAQLRGLYEEHPDFPRAPEALFQAAEILNLYQQQYAEALLVYLLLERDFPESLQTRQALRRMADLYKHRLADYSQAIVVYQKALDHAEDADRLQYEVADSYFRLNNFEQARIEFEGLQKNYPESALLPEVQFRVAVTYALEGQLPEAAGAYRAVVERWPDSPYAMEARFGLAGVLEEQEELLEAQSVLEGLQGTYPNPELLQKKLEKVQSRIDKKKKAI
jgi:TolA-binding protein